MTVQNQLREVLAWRLLSETVRHTSHGLRIYELHPGGGMYDCLALYTMSGSSVCHLNRAGRFHVQGDVHSPAAGSPTLKP